MDCGELQSCEAIRNCECKNLSAAKRLLCTKCRVVPDIPQAKVKAADERMRKAYKKYLTDCQEEKTPKAKSQRISTRDLLLHYMKYRFENEGYNIDDSEDIVIRCLFKNTGILTTSFPGKILADLGNRIDSDHSNKMFLERSIAVLNITHTDVRAHYFGWLNMLFKDKKITWGRLALTLVFSARLAQEAMMMEEYDRVALISLWCCQYFKYNMFEEWIVSSGGWDELPPVDPVKTISLLSRLPDKLTVACAAMAFIASFTASLFMVR